MSAIRVLVAAILFAAAGFVTSARATSATTDQSDLWWVPTESGWGIQLVQRGPVIFATMFVYDQGTNPIWYTATLNYLGNLVWTGDLLLVHGVWFGAANFNQAPKTYRKVGTMTWTATTVTDGTLRYDVDGVPVTKLATRQLLRYDDFSGTYNGAIYASYTGCFAPSGNLSANAFQVAYVTQTGQNVTVSLVNPTNGSTVTVTGPLTQSGQFGSVSGTFTASAGADAGNAVLFEMNVQLTAFSMRYITTSTKSGCVGTGYFSGARTN